MRKMWVVASREYRVTIRTKTFLIALILMPVFMGGSIGIQVLLEGRVDTSTKRIAVVDHSGQMFAAMDEAAKEHNQEIVDPQTGKQKGAGWEFVNVPPNDADRERQLLDLSDQVRAKQIFAFMEIDADVLRTDPVAKTGRGDTDPVQERPDPPRFSGPRIDKGKSAGSFHSSGAGQGGGALVRYHSNQPTYFEIGVRLQRIISSRVKDARLIAAHIDPALVRQASQEVTVDNLGLLAMGESGQIKPAAEVNMGVAFGVPFGLTMLMFMALAMTAQPMLNGVLEEKMNRIAEVLLGSVPPFELMLGKLIGYVGVAITLVAVYVVGGYIVASHYGYGDAVPMWLFGWFLVYQCLAILMYGSLFLAIGACCNELREAQNLMLPVWLILCIPLFTLSVVVQHPDSTLATALSLFPPATPLLMVARMAVPPGVPLWQPLVGIVGTLITTVVCVWAAGRIFRIGLLLQGKPPKIGELVRWVVRG